MNDGELQIAGHMLGVNVYHATNSTKKKDKKLPKDFYRNYFCIGGDSEKNKDFPILESLEEKEYAFRRKQFDQIVFHLTDSGIENFKICFTNKTENEEKGN